MKLRHRATALSAAAAMSFAGLAALALDQTASAAPASDLMFSVYIEGTSNNKAYELHNPTAVPIELAGYTVELYTNGSTSTTSKLPLSGTLAPGGHYVVTNSQAGPALAAKGNLAHSTANYNGDDVLVLKKGTAVLDSLGRLGFDPGTNWSADGVATSEMTLTKKGCTVDVDPADTYVPSVDWKATAQDDFTTLGSFTCGPPASPTPTASASASVSPTAPVSPGASTLVGAVQGVGNTSPMVGRTVTVEGVVVGSFMGENQFNGYYLQGESDGNEESSDAIFVYAPNGPGRSQGDTVKVTGTVAEFYGQTQIAQASAEVLATGAALPAPVALALPTADRERYEGMYVTFPAALSILEYYNYGRYGEIVYGTQRQHTGTAVAEPGPAANAVTADNLAKRVIVDDGRGNQNPTGPIHPNGKPFTVTNYFRGGDTVANLTGVLSYRNDAFKLQPTKGGDHTAANPRPAAPEVGGNLKVASFNVLNYFTTLTSQDKNARGADTPEEFERQQAKIVEAIAAIDADVVGMMEIENNGTAVENLVAALNNKMGAGTYKAINTGRVGTDAIFQAIIYKPATAQPMGDWKAYDFKDQKNRPSLVQTFKHLASGELLNLDINHLKSKGSDCGAADPDLRDGAGNCNLTRKNAAETIVNWLKNDPTGQGAARTIIMGDLNSYDHEDPIDAFVAGGFTDLEKKFHGEHAYSYVFDGQLGYLDYGMANEAAVADVTGTASWHINADEVSLLDYDMSFKAPAEDALYEANPYRASDHDPVIIGLQLGGPTASPSPSVEPSTSPSVDPSTSPSVEPSTSPSVDPSPSPSADPSTSPSVDPSPSPSVSTSAAPAPSPHRPTLIAPYEVPGFHIMNGRHWYTTCEPYSQTIRCRTEIWSKQVVLQGGKYIVKQGWFFNNLTYLPFMTRAQWGSNPLAKTGQWTNLGRKYKTECDTAVTGKGACRSFIWGTKIQATPVAPGKYTYKLVNGWVFNNIVRLKN